MKKWLTYILLSVLLLTAVPSFSAAAAETDWSGTFTASGDNINVTLSAPQAQTEDITSLHYRIYISIANGSMDAPTFQFANTVESKVKDVAAIKDDASNYILDIILSGTKDQNIFKTGQQADIGTITLHPTTNTYKITADFTPVAEYVTSEGQYAEEVSLINTKPVTIEKTGTNSSGSNGSGIFIGSGGTAIDYTGGGSGTSTTAVPSTMPSASPGNTASPASSVAPSTSTPAGSAAPTTTEQPAASQEPALFDINQRPKLKTAVAKGSKNVKFSWDKVDGADGYIISQYNPKNSKYKGIKTISNPDKTTCSIKMSYATSYSFRIRAFKTSEDDSKIYGKYSSIIKVTTAPAKTNGLKVKRARNSKVSISWKKVPRAKGYQIFSSKKKNGKYSLVKTIKKNSALSTTVKQKSKKACYYKVRAYVTSANKKRVYGNFSKSLSLKS